MASTLGVDLGLSGGLAWLTGLLDTDPRYVIPMPKRKAVGSNRPDTRVVKAWVNTCVREHGPPGLVVIERTQTMGSGKDAGGQSRGKQGARQLHTQGFNGGIIVGIFELLGYPIEEPTPQAWKKSVLTGFKDKDKAAMIAVCQQRFPTLILRSGSQAKKDHDGMADAVGLAMFGQYRIGNVPT